MENTKTRASTDKPNWWLNSLVFFLSWFVTALTMGGAIFIIAPIAIIVFFATKKVKVRWAALSSLVWLVFLGVAILIWKPLHLDEWGLTPKQIARQRAIQRSMERGEDWSKIEKFYPER